MPNSVPARTTTVGLDDRIPIASANLLLLLFSNNTPASQSVRNRTPRLPALENGQNCRCVLQHCFFAAQLRPPRNRAAVHPSVARSEQTPFYMSARLISTLQASRCYHRYACSDPQPASEPNALPKSMLVRLSCPLYWLYPSFWKPAVPAVAAHLV